MRFVKPLSKYTKQIQTKNYILGHIFVFIVLFSSHISANDLLIMGMKIQVDRFEITGNNPFSDKKTQTLLKSYLGEHRGVEGIEAAADALENALKQSGFHTYHVHVPAQSLASGLIQLQISDSPQNTVDKSSLTEQKKGRNFSIQFDNTGDESTGKYRSTIKLKQNKLFGKEHTATLAYSVSPTKSSDVDQYGLDYEILLDDIDSELSFMAWNSKSNVVNVTSNYQSKGAGKVYGLGMTRYLPNQGKYQHHVNVSLKDKLLNSNLSVDDTLSNSDVRSRPLSISYNGKFTTQNTDTYFSTSYRKNLSGGSKNNQSDYDAYHSGAVQAWNAMTLGASVDYWLPKKWLLHASIDGQHSDTPLIYAEQFGMGGSSSLLGFEEWEVLGDRGYKSKLELMTPRFSNGSYLFTRYELGRVKRLAPLANEPVTEKISSLGLGVSSPLGKKCDMTLQGGYVLNGVDDLTLTDRTQKGDSRLHFNFLCQLK